MVPISPSIFVQDSNMLCDWSPMLNNTVSIPYPVLTEARTIRKKIKKALEGDIGREANLEYSAIFSPLAKENASYKTVHVQFRI